ncbi:TPA_asm: pentapeptide repeat-containing protein [Salmonella enterica subsp. enterica serovar Newport]|uniref:Pentapeptide repeat-containing protein n=1 Tax=Salmonella enterica TaxID=28901 RepID=A0A749V7J8_SALER|nr:pentapeptide repeat-containing protein [Salmonella enterica subsp. enterica serovar Newport]HAF5977146.1 pentapeptide repeat-containing protein [Salmonella enterica]EBR0082237.1 pentapeptide repeat-containing protein [Salmonella enterica subsp. enterica serovar Newport]EBS5386091.1 pentapeptide repeat-containing protein [Salmonella enterica subsp. enterica serovar Newport]EBX4439999.1 pentapeptide repeat-containing protein [Salmonella enterica subsp. enterica serovar Newport]
MNSADLSKILEEHKVWITSMRESGSRANLRGANLYGADLRGANLCDANLRGANLRGANLYGADLCGANLCDANLCGANLRGANLYGADLCGANLCDANLCDANLRGANLCDANLRGANLRGANLRGADLPDLTFVILGEKYFISITNGEYVRAGCQNHTVEEWRKYSKQEIAEMDGRKALKFYPRLLDIIDFYIGKGERPDWLTSKEYADEVTG